jgi:hypothetical protein
MWNKFIHPYFCLRKMVWQQASAVRQNNVIA